MTGKHENDRCYFCGGHLETGLATIPFVVGANVVVIRQVPAEICTQCGEPVIDSETAEIVDGVLKRARESGFEVSVVNYEQIVVAAGS